MPLNMERKGGGIWGLKKTPWLLHPQHSLKGWCDHTTVPLMDLPLGPIMLGVVQTPHKKDSLPQRALNLCIR